MNSEIEPEIKIKPKQINHKRIHFIQKCQLHEDTNIKALQNISFTVKKGETLAILKQVLGNQLF
jgi:ATP-binding cassette subfamily B protein